MITIGCVAMHGFGPNVFAFLVRRNAMDLLVDEIEAMTSGDSVEVIRITSDDLKDLDSNAIVTVRVPDEATRVAVMARFDPELFEPSKKGWGGPFISAALAANLDAIGPPAIVWRSYLEELYKRTVA